MRVIPVIPSCRWYRFRRDVQCVRGRRVIEIVCVLPACVPLPDYLLIRVRGSLIVSISMRLDNFEVNAKVFIPVHSARI